MSNLDSLYFYLWYKPGKIIDVYKNGKPQLIYVVPENNIIERYKFNCIENLSYIFILGTDGYP